ncbi:hypothetical protein [Streptomyces sp. NPDC054901]
MTSAFAGDGTELVGEVAGGGQVGAGIQDSVELFTLVVGQLVGAAHDPGRDAAGAGDRLRWFGDGRAGVECRDVLRDNGATAAVAAFANLTEEARGVGRAAAEAVL